MFSYFKGPHFNLLIWNYWLQKKLQDSINLLKQFENGTLPDGITDYKVGVWIFTTLGISRPFFDKKKSKKLYSGYNFSTGIQWLILNFFCLVAEFVNKLGLGDKPEYNFDL